MSKYLAVVLVVVLAFTAQAYDPLTPEESYEWATEFDHVFILDVRTPEEWVWVGHPGQNALGQGVELADKVVNISLKFGVPGAMIMNPRFLVDVGAFLEYVEDKFDPDDDETVLIVMCRSGKRSELAAALLEAWDDDLTVYNMVTGFEGGKDAAGYRTVNGWANDGFPYSYSTAGMYQVGMFDEVDYEEDNNDDEDDD